VVLGQNAPNPVRAATDISFVLPAKSPVRLSVHDVAGRLVATLLEGERTAGAHRVTWSGADAAGRSVPGGVYFYRLATSEETYTKRLTVIR
jgi:flagellar hook assembly protein FlgD